MPPATAEAARQFRENLNSLDPTGMFRKAGEFGQSYRMENNQVLPNGPMIYEAGSSVAGQAMRPGTFTNIHSHNWAPPPMSNDFPSPNDHLAAREAAKIHGQPHELMYHPESNTFFAYSGEVPPVFFEAHFPPPPVGPAHGNCTPALPPIAALLPHGFLPPTPADRASTPALSGTLTYPPSYLEPRLLPPPGPDYS